MIVMVSELHRMGYQHLRIMPYAYPLAWRLAIAPRSCFSEAHGAILMEGTHGSTATYSAAGGGNHYFDWRDAERLNARSLAELFVQRFPAIAARGRGSDWAYAGWLCDLISVIERCDYLPLVLWEDIEEEPESLQYLPLWSMGEDGPQDTAGGQFALPPLRDTTDL
ncbi:hypothetical protein [Caenimonas soli]|uniref:hypothetical protein n=1 Tax=Caenimonas soli TaxID=2735555 RepID=UPI00155665B3|nr:hypothetical protein [Caenimonas soli]NPC56672.1 hypothetical protein [Caenimonas soli]